MIRFEVLDTGRSGLSWFPTFGSILAAAFTALLACPEPPGRLLPPGQAAVHAAVYVVLVGGATALAARASFAAFFPAADGRLGAVVLAHAGNGVWLAPLTFFVAQGQIWPIPALALLAFATVRLLRRSGRGIEEDEAQEVTARDGGMFAGVALAGPSRSLLMLIPAVVLMEGGLVACVDGRAGTAAVLAGSGFFLLACAAVRTVPQSPDGPPSRPLSGLVLRSTCAGALIALALVRIPANSHSRDRSGGPGGRSASPVHASEEGLFSGAILRTAGRHVKLVAPIPQAKAALWLYRPVEAASIEFSGEYWIFPIPMQRPPRSSMIAHATPIAWTFTSVDRSALIMQARQQLGVHVSSRCCSAIEVAVRNTDKQPETIALAMSLASSAPPRRPAQRLGVQRLPEGQWSVLRFPLPARPTLAEFDEVLVDLHLSAPRMHRSANVSIQRFVFIPRVL